MPIMDQDALKERSKVLKKKGLNGIDFVLVSLKPDQNQAELEVHFFNSNHVEGINARNFVIAGGQRIQAGDSPGNIRVIGISAGPDKNSVTLTVAPIGDYSTYTMMIVNYDDKIDPLFNEIDFKFRPGCFNIDCSPIWTPAEKPAMEPVIDYLSKDYDSFKHTLINAMMERIPGWRPTSEADLSVVLLDLFCAIADELSDYQDRVMNEAYLNTSRKRVSVARHAQLMDYYIGQGNQADTWLAVNVIEDVTINVKEDVAINGGSLHVWSGSNKEQPESIIFITREENDIDFKQVLNEMHLYTWDDTIPTLKAGDTSAYIKFPSSVDVDNTVIKWINDEKIKHLLIQEWLNPETGRESGTDPNKRQLLELLSSGMGARKVYDPLHADVNIVKVFWQEKDRLRANYCFTVTCDGTKVSDVSRFHGNLVQVFQGTLKTSEFVNDIQKLEVKTQCCSHHTGVDNYIDGSQSLSGFANSVSNLGNTYKIPEGPLAYLDTKLGGDIPPRSTLEISVECNGKTDGTKKEMWTEVPNLIHSNEADTHYVVETDGEGRSVVRFGNGINGKSLPDGARVTCSYQVGRGPDGNVGTDTLTGFDNHKFPAISRCWNPFDVTNGRDQEPVEKIMRRVPEAYKTKQLRAVTLKDYVAMAEQIPGVSKAAARYAWTGSWRTVQIAIDPVGTHTLDYALQRTVAQYLGAVKLIGEDFEIRPPEFVPLEIHVVFCVLPGYWEEDVKTVVEQEFSNGYSPDGKMGFFHPDLWTFGQELRKSQIIGRVQSVQGVDYVVGVEMKRWDRAMPGTDDVIKVKPNEIILVMNNPDYMEKGFIDFEARGGRQ